MFFASDNTGPAHPKVLAALADANEGHVPSYGEDPLTARATALIREAFDAPDAAVHLVATGTAANALLLASLCQPWQTVFCSDVAHVHQDECAAPEFYTGGAKLTLVPHDGGKIRPDRLRARIEGEENRGVHGPQRGPVTVTQATEKGTIYTHAELAAITQLAHGFDLPVHMDGSRFANALAAGGGTPADMTWRAGIDALSFGGTKNGLLGVEAAVQFDPARSWEFELRRKRGAHLFSKHRFLAAQMVAYLEDGLWLQMAADANAACAALARGLSRHPDVRLLYPADANIVFAAWPRGLHRQLLAAGADYHLWEGELDDGPEDEPLTARLVCGFDTTDSEIDRFLALLAAG
ncbi:low specificity L-threonine aldolase [Tropicimonas sp. IMCC34043]|uniref:threonine aldolase family protein n=1 Tax=Tropicimonas sp. IMCC34043 TaxID=2248760 RepID=UPI000E246A86|nr:beta-eliminating lyase-related protein [Tropicimonas sp. IMCC34043]